MIKLGIDIGGTGIKGALINTITGEFASKRVRILTPKKASPKEVVKIIKGIIKKLKWEGAIGIGFPGLIRNNICISTGNLSSSWNDLNLLDFFGKHIKHSIKIGNDADVAGLAESKFGFTEEDKKNHLILFLTLGTGVGSAIIINEQLIPESELGYMRYKKSILEDYISNSVRIKKKMGWKKYGKKLNVALHTLNNILSPNKIIIGGGISKVFSKYSPYIDKDLNVVPAKLQNSAGIIGAALL